LPARFSLKATREEHIQCIETNLASPWLGLELALKPEIFSLDDLFLNSLFVDARQNTVSADVSDVL